MTGKLTTGLMSRWTCITDYYHRHNYMLRLTNGRCTMTQ